MGPSLWMVADSAVDGTDGMVDNIYIYIQIAFPKGMRMYEGSLQRSKTHQDTIYDILTKFKVVFWLQ